ncbi:LytR/AlgR family response regulator transcription factor [Ekhidna sp.]
MKVLLLDDEVNARDTIKAYLSRFSGADFDIRETDSISDAQAILKEFKPDIVLLDINLKEGTGFDLLSLIGIDNITFKVIFITASDGFAIKAFKFNAVDYILKPVNPLEFDQTIQKTIKSLDKLPSENQLKNLEDNLSDESRFLDRIVLRDQQQIQLVKTQDIIYCSSENNYTMFHMVDGSTLVISKTLKEYDDLLTKKHFFRSHRSHLINLDHFKKYDKREGGSIQMQNGTIVPLARNKKDIFMKLIERV